MTRDHIREAHQLSDLPDRRNAADVRANRMGVRGLARHLRATPSQQYCKRRLVGSGHRLNAYLGRCGLLS